MRERERCLQCAQPADELAVYVVHALYVYAHVSATHLLTVLYMPHVLAVDACYTCHCT
jgi:hypothetical protein